MIPISSRAPEIWPLRLAVTLPQGKPSFLVLPGIRQVNKVRLYEAMGSVSNAMLVRVDEAVQTYLGS